MEGWVTMGMGRHLQQVFSHPINLGSFWRWFHPKKPCSVCLQLGAAACCGGAGGNSLQSTPNMSVPSMRLQYRNNSRPAKLNTSCSPSYWHFAFCQGSGEEADKQPSALSCGSELGEGMWRKPLLIIQAEAASASCLRSGKLRHSPSVCMHWAPPGAPPCPALPQLLSSAPGTAPALPLFNGEVISQRCLKLP